MSYIADITLVRHARGVSQLTTPQPVGSGVALSMVIVRTPRATINFAISPAVTEAPIIRADQYLYVAAHARFVPVVGPPAGISLQVQNSLGGWETVWTYTASS